MKINSPDAPIDFDALAAEIQIQRAGDVRESRSDGDYLGPPDNFHPGSFITLDPVVESARAKHSRRHPIINP